MRIAYGTMTKSIEDPSQLLLLDLDSRFDELDPDQTITLLEDTEQDQGVPWQMIVGLDDALRAVRGVLLDAGYVAVDDLMAEVRERLLRAS